MDTWFIPLGSGWRPSCPIHAVLGARLRSDIEFVTGKAIMSGKLTFGTTVKLRLFALVLACIALALPSVAPLAADSGYMLGSGDKVRVTVFGETDLTGE